MKWQSILVVMLAVLLVPSFSKADLNLLTNPGAETGDLTGWTVVDDSEGGPVSTVIGLLTPPMPWGYYPQDPGPHSGSYLFSSDRSSYDTGGYSGDDIWYMTQVVATGGAPSVRGYVWGATDYTEYMRLVVSEHYDSTWSVIYDSSWVNSGYKWTQLSFDWTDLNPSTYELEFKMGGYKPSGIGVANSASLDDAYLEVVPAPGAVLLGLLGLGFSGWKLRRRREL